MSRARPCRPRRDREIERGLLLFGDRLSGRSAGHSSRADPHPGRHTMIRRSCISAAFAIAALATPSAADLKLPRISPDSKVTQTLGFTDLTVTYSRPGVKKRTIWGDLVPYDKEWRTGANNATTFAT